MKKIIFLLIAIILVFLSASVVLSEIKANFNYEKEFVGAFKAKIDISGLKSNHEYILTLNGYKNHSSNNKLIEECEIQEGSGEGYCDFKKASTDSKGALNVDIEEELPAGKYKVKFFIKDHDTWGVVWGEDLVKFEVLEDIKK